MSGITLSASMRANLLSLQQTAHLQAMTQGRLATGKKVNSALDNPTSFFAASSLNQRANDLSNLLDGMGQAIQTITAATQGITAAESLITQMQSVAQSAAQSITGTTNTQSTTKTYNAYKAQGTQSASATNAAATGNYNTTAMTGGSALASTSENLAGLVGSAGALQSGDVLTVAVGGAAAVNFTISSTVSTAAGNGSGSTIADLNSWLGKQTGGTVAAGALTATVAGGKLFVNDTQAAASATNCVTLSGSMATALGLTTTHIIPAGAAAAASSVALTDTSTSTSSLVGLVTTNGEITQGATLTVGTATFTVSNTVTSSYSAGNGSGNTMGDLQAWLSMQGTQGKIQGTVAAGALAISNSTAATVSIGGTMATTLGLSSSVANGATDTATKAAYSAYASMTLTDLTSGTGANTTSLGVAAGDTLVLTDETNSAKNATFTVGASVSTGSGNGGGNTVADLYSWLQNQKDTSGNTLAALSFSSNKPVLTNSSASDTLTVSGSLASALGVVGTLGDTGAASHTISSTTQVGNLPAPTNAYVASSNTDYQYSMTSLIGTNGNALDILSGDQMTVQVGGGSTYTFTVGGSSANNTIAGNGGGTTLHDLATWLGTVTGSSVGYSSTTGQMQLGAVSSGVTIGGSLANELGLAANNTTNSVVGTQGLYNSSYTGLSAATTSTMLSDLTNSSGQILYNSSTKSGSTGTGDTLTLQLGTGTVNTFTIGATSTVQDLVNEVNSISGLSASISSSGQLTLNNTSSSTLTIGGTAQGLLGNTTSVASNGSASQTLYAGYGAVSSSSLGSTNLTALAVPSGQSRLTSGDQLSVTVGGNTTNITVNSSGAGSSTSATTVSDLVSALNKISGITATLNSTTGALEISAASGQTVTLGGTAASKLNLPGSLNGSVVSSTYLTQYDTLRTQLDQLVQDSSYQGINLIDGTPNASLTVTFNNSASSPNALVIQGVNLTTSGLSLTSASDNWNSSSAVQSSITALTNATTTLRAQSTSFGQNLTTVQTRQDFTNNLINTLQTGAGDLVNADMNTESANMLALQTQQQLGISSLSLASQAAQGILKLFP